MNVQRYIFMAVSVNVQMFVVAQTYYSARSTGLQMLQQVLIADTSNMLDRALFSSLPNLPFPSHPLDPTPKVVVELRL